MNKVGLAVIGVGLLFFAGTGVASADRDNGTDAFLCPIVGEAAGGTFLPGSNQAGPHANEHAINSVGDGTPGPGNVPGADGFTPIWSGPPA